MVGMSDATEAAPVFARAFADSPAAMVATDASAPDNPIVWANDAFLALSGYGLEEVVGRNCRMMQGPDTDRSEVARLRAAIAAGEAAACEILNYRKDGTTFWCALTISPVRDREGRVSQFFAVQADVTERRRAEEAMRGAHEALARDVAERTAALEEALAQKTALLHEVDHRVKNNLQVISALMLLKARRTPEGETREALQGMAERVGALSTAHRILYDATDATQFDLAAFADSFLSDFTAGLDPARTRVEASVDSIAVSAAMAAPLALMIHELATNAVRHAFPDAREGRLVIAARRDAEGLHMRIEDDGIGLSAASENPAGFGRSLVEMVVRQMRGTIAWRDGAPGTHVEVRIPLERSR